MFYTVEVIFKEAWDKWLFSINRPGWVLLVQVESLRDNVCLLHFSVPLGEYVAYFAGP
jgi:hypothetical protein